MTPADYLDEIVLPAILDFQEDRRSRRKAYVACVLLFHLKDHLKVVEKTSIEPRIREGSKSFAEVSAFDIIRDVCNGAKHSVLNGKHKLDFSAGDDEDRPPGFWGVATWGRSKFGDIHGGREVMVHGEYVDLFEAVTATLNVFLQEFEGQLGSVSIPSALLNS